MFRKTLLINNKYSQGPAAPGKSGIIKLPHMKFPENAVSKFRDLLNATILMGYFPFLLKNKKKKKKKKKKQNNNFHTKAW